MAKRTRLISLATTYPDSPGSTEPRFVHLLNMELARLGIDVLAICPRVKNSAKHEVMEGVRIRRFKYLPKRFMRSSAPISDRVTSRLGILGVTMMVASFFLVTLFSCLRSRPDIVHGQWAFPGGYIAYVMSRIFSAKAVMTVHYTEIPLLERFGFLRRAVVNGLNRSFMVIAVSEFTRKKLVKLGVAEKNITVIRSVPNFVPHVSDERSLEELRRKIAPPDRRIILFCGRLVEYKGVQYLIRSIPKIRARHVHLVVVGDGSMMGRLQELARGLGVDDRTTFYGRATHEELGMIHGISDVFVCPSIVDSRGNEEALGLVIPEAMESGLPVVASATGGIVDIVRDGENGLLVAEKDPDSIAKAIDSILADSGLRERIVRNSRKTVTEFSPEAIARRHMEVFEM